MNKRLITIGLFILAISIVIKLFIVGISHIKVDEFHKSSIVFVIDSTNSQKLPDEIKYIQSLCAILDPEDSIKIIKVSQSAYLIFEGSPGDSSGIKKAIESYTKNDSNIHGVAYNEGIKKAFENSLTMAKDGYNSSVVVIGELDSSANEQLGINWKTLPANIKKIKEYTPELAMMFVYATPEKLDLVKTKLNPILGEKKLIISNEANIDKANRRFLDAIGR